MADLSPAASLAPSLAGKAMAPRGVRAPRSLVRTTSTGDTRLWGVRCYYP